MRIENARFYFDRLKTHEQNCNVLHHKEKTHRGSYAVPYYFPKSFSADVIVGDQEKKTTTFSFVGKGSYNLVYSFETVEDGKSRKRVLRIPYSLWLGEIRENPLHDIKRSCRIANEKSGFQLSAFIVNIVRPDNVYITAMVSDFINHNPDAIIAKHLIKEAVVRHFLHTGRNILDITCKGNTVMSIDDGMLCLPDKDFGLRMKAFRPISAAVDSREPLLGRSPASEALFGEFFRTFLESFYANELWAPSRDVFNLMCSLWMLQVLGVSAEAIKRLELESDKTACLTQFLGELFQFVTMREGGTEVSGVDDRPTIDAALSLTILKNYSRINAIAQFFIPNDNQDATPKVNQDVIPKVYPLIEWSRIYPVIRERIRLEIHILRKIQSSFLYGAFQSESEDSIDDIIDSLCLILKLAKMNAPRTPLNLVMLDNVLFFASKHVDWMKLGIEQNGLAAFSQKSTQDATIDPLFARLDELRYSQQPKSETPASGSSLESVDFSQSLFRARQRDSSPSPSPVEMVSGTLET